jgi:TetR/AcrR family transcriptional regulator, mexJK operon transcriptional repressor
MVKSFVHGESSLPKTVARPESHRERILDAASEVFLECGFEQSSTAEIARRARISKRELYSHFADKRALLGAVIAELQTSIGSRMDVRWSSSEDMETVLRKSAAAIYDFILSERFGKLVRIVAAESYHDPAVARQFFELGPLAGRKATARYLKAKMEEGQLRKADPIKAADHFLDLVVGAQLMTAVILGQVSPAARKRDHVHHAVEVFLRVYGNPQAPRGKRSTRKVLKA